MVTEDNMKSSLAKVSLALLSAVFILGCQDLGSGPVGPDGLVPQFDKKESGVCDDPRDGHCHGDDEEPASGSLSYMITNFGAITTDPSPIKGRRGVGKNSQKIDMGAPVTLDKMVFTEAFADAFDSERQCFPREADFTTVPLGGFINDAFTASLRPDKKDPETINGAYWFKAFGKDRVTTFDYVLVLTGSFKGGSFPPVPDQTTTVTWLTAELATEGSGKGSKGGNLGSACVGSVDAVTGGVHIVGV
jgi:hypothetical protein